MNLNHWADGAWAAGSWEPSPWGGVAAAPVVAVYGGGGGRRKKITRRTRYYSSIEPEAREVIVAVAEAQVETPAPEPIRRQQLTHALLEKSIAVQERHLAALEAERERIIGETVAQYLKKLQEQEDEAFVLALAEAL